MSDNNSVACMSQTSILIFDDVEYEHWSIMIRTLFCSHHLWNLVEHGLSKEDNKKKAEENKQQDSHALFLI